MSGQLSFISAEAPQEGLFFALFPDLATVARLSQLAQQQCIRHRLSGVPSATDRLHVSLLNLGKYPRLPRGLAEDMAKAAATVAASPFEVTFDRVLSFAGRPRPLVLAGEEGVAELAAFRERLGEAISETSGGLVRPAYTPHVTLLYDDRAIEPHTVEPVSWTVREFVLVHSYGGRSRYVSLARFPLEARFAFA
jgi:2'-5' RNA ligase